MSSLVVVTWQQAKVNSLFYWFANAVNQTTIYGERRSDMSSSIIHMFDGFHNISLRYDTKRIGGDDMWWVVYDVTDDGNVTYI